MPDPKRGLRDGLFAAITVVAIGCGGGGSTSADSNDSVASTCVAGASAACTGVGGCAGFQVCGADGKFAACDCSTASSAPGPDGGTNPGDGGVNDPAKPWSVTDLPGLSLWLDDTVGVVADAANAGHVRRWLDQSGNGATTEAPDALAADEPTINPAVLNGHDAISFATSNNHFTSSAGLGTSDFALVFVARLTAATGNVAFVGPLYVSEILPRSFLWTGSGTPSLTLPLVVGTFQIFVLRGNTAVELDVGAASTKGGTIPAAATSLPLLISGEYGVPFDLAEVIETQAAMSDADLAKVRAYLTAKFKL